MPSAVRGKKHSQDRKTEASHSKEGGAWRCVDRSWCQLRLFSEEQKDSSVFVRDTEENKQEMLYPGGRIELMTVEITGQMF